VVYNKSSNLTTKGWLKKVNTIRLVWCATKCILNINGADLDLMSQPRFWKNVKMTLTFPKWELGSPSRLSKLQSRIAGDKTPRIEVFFISLENYENLDVENELAWSIWTFAAQVTCKRRVESQIGNLTPTTKSWESTRPRGVRGEWDTPLESSQGEL
jgi:hypothetical protein